MPVMTVCVLCSLGSHGVRRYRRLCGHEGSSCLRYAHAFLDFAHVPRLRVLPSVVARGVAMGAAVNAGLAVVPQIQASINAPGIMD